MKQEKYTILRRLLLIASILMIINGVWIAANNAPIIVSSSTPIIVRCNRWEDFKALAKNAENVTFIQNGTESLRVEALKTFNSSGEIEQKILTYSGDFPRDQTGKLQKWLATELEVDERAITKDLISLKEVMEAPFWGRLSLGIPGMVEGNMVYFWLLWPILILVFAFQIYRKPRLYRNLGSWIVTFSLMSIPIGGGFIVGVVVGVVIGFVGMEWPKPLGETFFGRLLRSLRGDPKVFELIKDDPTLLNSAALTIILVAFLSGTGNALYAFNVSKIHPSDNVVALVPTYDILVHGTTFIGIPVYFTTIAYISIGIIKWLILSLIVYFIGAKLAGRNSEYGNIARVLAFAYVPEALQVFMPLMFPNEPMLSTGFQIFFIPISWPLIFFYITRLWVFILLVISLERLLDTPRGKAVGIAFFTGTLYWLTNYLFINPILNIPGFAIAFTPESSLGILVLASAAFLIATVLGTFKKG